ncbi:MAG: DUF1801 domain-containing protein [Candidatus Methylomirabilales bacterium]
MGEPKTRVTNESVSEFLDGVTDEGQRKDSYALLELMEKATKSPPKMWGTSIVGFGSYHYKYASGREGDWPLTGFSPRKRNLTLYIMDGFDGYEALLTKLGKHTTGKACLYIKTLDDIHLPTLRKIVRQSVKHVAQAHK